MLHIDDNMTKEIENGLRYFEEWLPGLIQMSYLFGVTHHRERFVQVCINEVAEFVQYAPLFGKNFHSTIDWRWSSILLLLRDLEVAGPVFRKVWNKQRWLRKQDSEEVAAANRLLRNPRG